MRKRSEAEIEASSAAIIAALRSHGSYLRREVPADPEAARLALSRVYKPNGGGRVIDRIAPSVFYRLLAEGKIVHCERLKADGTSPAVDYYKIGKNV